MERRNKKTKQVGNGEGSLYYSDKLQKWIYQYYDTNNKRQTMTQKKNEAVRDFKKRVTELKNQLDTGTYIPKNKETLYDICKEIVEDKKQSNIICPNTYKRSLYTLSYINNGNIANKPIQQINSKMIKDYLQTTTIYAQTTIDKIYQLLGQAFRRAIDRRYIIENPMLKEEVKKPKSDKKTKVVEALTIDEEKKLIEILSNQEIDHKYRNIILLMLFTGLRIGEVLALKYNNIKENINNSYFLVDDTLTRDDNDNVILREKDENRTKTENSVRWIDITPEVKTILNTAIKQYIINPDNLLFYDEVDCKFITPSEVNNYLRRINNKYNISSHLHNHILRHTYATRLIEAGTDIDVIKNKLGHKKIETTINTYCSLLELRKSRQNELISKYYEENNISL
ncbi:MAG: site-specific integrase [Clostridia bacterium]|nr:site-specific integrase [Clostridia bacterium]